jgi:predicted kinase
MNTLPTLLMTVGLPRSGKSTWARSTGLPVVNPDSIRLALHGQRFVKQAEGMVWTVAHLMVDALFLAGHRTVILDATNVTAFRRAEWQSPDYFQAYVLFDTPMDECIRRAHATGQSDLEPVIRRMNSQLNWPVTDVKLRQGA